MPKFRQKYPAVLEKKLILLLLLFLVMAAILDIRPTQFYTSKTLVADHAPFKFENCRCNSFIEKMFEYLFSSVDRRCMTHDAQWTITPLKIIGEQSPNNMRYSTS